MTAHTPAHQGVVIFKLADRVCAFDLRCVREIVHMAELSRPVGLPPLIEGFLILEGQPVPVVDLRQVFELPRLSPGLYTPLMIMPGETCLSALMVDEIVDVCLVPKTELLPVDTHPMFNDCLIAETQLETATVHVLDADRVLLKQEQQCLDQLAQLAQKRLKNLTTFENSQEKWQ